MTLTGGSISSNSANSGGGILNNPEGTVDLNGGSISGNSASADGGGIYNFGGTLVNKVTTITGNTPDNVVPWYDSYT